MFEILFYCVLLLTVHFSVTRIIHCSIPESFINDFLHPLAFFLMLPLLVQLGAGLKMLHNQMTFFFSFPIRVSNFNLVCQRLNVSWMKCIQCRIKSNSSPGHVELDEAWHMFEFCVSFEQQTISHDRTPLKVEYNSPSVPITNP